MVSWSETEPKYKLLIIVVGCLAIAGAVWFTLIRPLEQSNRNDKLALTGKRAEIAQLLPFQARMGQLNAEIEQYRKQLEEQKQIVPEEKNVDGFIRTVQSEARASGIELRRFTAMPIVTKEFYSEAPFELELDGSYFGVLRFYERIAKMDRLVNVSGLQMSNVKTPAGAKAKKTYQYAPSETVVATCTASAFFVPPPAPPAPAVRPPGLPPLPPGQAAPAAPAAPTPPAPVAAPAAPAAAPAAQGQHPSGATPGIRPQVVVPQTAPAPGKK